MREDIEGGVTTTEEELAALRGLGGKKKEEWQKEATETEKVSTFIFTFLFYCLATTILF